MRRLSPWHGAAEEKLLGLVEESSPELELEECPSLSSSSSTKCSPAATGTRGRHLALCVKMSKTSTSDSGASGRGGRLLRDPDEFPIRGVSDRGGPIFAWSSQLHGAARKSQAGEHWRRHWSCRLVL